jgi:tellurite resistance protein TehA-like permease
VAGRRVATLLVYAFFLLWLAEIVLCLFATSYAIGDGVPFAGRATVGILFGLVGATVAARALIARERAETNRKAVRVLMAAAGFESLWVAAGAVLFTTATS